MVWGFPVGSESAGLATFAGGSQYSILGSLGNEPPFKMSARGEDMKKQFPAAEEVSIFPKDLVVAIIGRKSKFTFLQSVRLFKHPLSNNDCAA